MSLPAQQPMVHPQATETSFDMNSISVMSIFGGDKPWSAVDWVRTDDTVRGGASVSELTINGTPPTAIFHGKLVKKLGEAAFASQRTTREDRNWDLSTYEGLVLDIAKSDEKQYTLTLKDAVLPPNPNGTDPASLTWQYDFKVKLDGEKVLIKWDTFKPTLKGREQKDAKPLDLKHVKRIGFMNRSFFGSQEGNFSLSINSLSAYRNVTAK
ncbi:hypothetical protein VTL71DRAFT_1689 [Oculimacula yallundae]|uniref:NADH:ubiquinone oxidoreductase intermediate-associated protein 30 domain-containing protein n=1 Tax=Oculimacula yallundae TaxID=86028 RepID=A0ABR4CBF9_9HELO